MQVRDEEDLLPGCLAHLRDWVDGFVAIDDGSVDSTPAILSREPKMLDVMTNPPHTGEMFKQERNSRQRLLVRAQELGASWVLCCDADERYEQAFLRGFPSIRAAAEENGRVRLTLRLRELWDSPTQYRVDGIWGQKTRSRVFPLPATMTFDNLKPLHGPWYPAELSSPEFVNVIDYNLYHLNMIRPEARAARRDRYNAIDPNKEAQEIGYDYLTDESGLKLESIPAGKEYDLSTLSPDLVQELGGV